MAIKVEGVKVNEMGVRDRDKVEGREYIYCAAHTHFLYGKRFAS